MDNDDLPVGQLLTRREMLALLGTTVVAATGFTQLNLSQVTATPEATATSTSSG